MTDFGAFHGSTPSRARIIAYWQKTWPSFVDDDEEPGCFACHIVTDDEGWPRLQRCHLIARSIDGPNDPSNFVILCEDCHRAAPMTDDRALMLQWVHERPSWLKLWLDMAAEAIRRAGIDVEVKTVDQQAFHDFMRKKKIDFHPYSTRYEKIACIAFLLREYLDTIP